MNFKKIIALVAGIIMSLSFISFSPPSAVYAADENNSVVSIGNSGALPEEDKKIIAQLVAGGKDLETVMEAYKRDPVIFIESYKSYGSGNKTLTTEQQKSIADAFNKYERRNGGKKASQTEGAKALASSLGKELNGKELGVLSALIGNGQTNQNVANSTLSAEELQAAKEQGLTVYGVAQIDDDAALMLAMLGKTNPISFAQSIANGTASKEEQAAWNAYLSAKSAGGSAASAYSKGLREKVGNVLGLDATAFMSSTTSSSEIVSSIEDCGDGETIESENGMLVLSGRVPGAESSVYTKVTVTMNFDAEGYVEAFLFEWPNKYPNTPCPYTDEEIMAMGRKEAETELRKKMLLEVNALIVYDSALKTRTSVKTFGNEVHTYIDHVDFVLKRADGQAIHTSEIPYIKKAQDFKDNYKLFRASGESYDISNGRAFDYLDAYFKVEEELLGESANTQLVIKSSYNATAITYTLDFYSSIRNISSKTSLSTEDIIRNYLSEYTPSGLDGTTHKDSGYGKTNGIYRAGEVGQTTNYGYAGSNSNSNYANAGLVWQRVENTIKNAATGKLLNIGTIHSGDSIFNFNPDQFKLGDNKGKYGYVPFLLTERPENSTIFNVTVDAYEYALVDQSSYTIADAHGKSWSFFSYREIPTMIQAPELGGANISIKEWNKAVDSGKMAEYNNNVEEYFLFGQNMFGQIGSAVQEMKQKYRDDMVDYYCGAYYKTGSGDATFSTGAAFNPNIPGYEGAWREFVICCQENNVPAAESWIPENVYSKYGIKVLTVETEEGQKCVGIFAGCPAGGNSSDFISTYSYSSPTITHTSACDEYKEATGSTNCEECGCYYHAELSMRNTPNMILNDTHGKITIPNFPSSKTSRFETDHHRWCWTQTMEAENPNTPEDPEPPKKPDMPSSPGGSGGGGTPTGGDGTVPTPIVGPKPWPTPITPPENLEITDQKDISLEMFITR